MSWFSLTQAIKTVLNFLDLGDFKHFKYSF